MSEEAAGPGPMTRASSRSLVRQSSSKPYMRRKSSAGAGSTSGRVEGTGLTKHAGEVSLSFDQEEAISSTRNSVVSAGEREEGKELPELAATARSRTLTGKALSLLPKINKKKTPKEDEEMEEQDGALTARSVSTFGRALSSFRQGKQSGPKEIDLWKPDADAILGITFEVSSNEHCAPAHADARGAPSAHVPRKRILKMAHVCHGLVCARCPPPRNTKGWWLRRFTRGI